MGKLVSLDEALDGCERILRDEFKDYPESALYMIGAAEVGNETLRPLIREYLFVSLFRACAESLACENASRLAAMQRADKKIGELLDALHGNFHRLRQSGIDEELFDLIS